MVVLVFYMVHKAANYYYLALDKIFDDSYLPCDEFLVLIKDSFKKMA